jgi:glycosyltransferase involved in cell wall biosynthesis
MMGEAAYAGLRDVLRRADPSPSAGAALEPSQAFITDMRAVIADARPRSQDRIFLPNLHWHEAAWLAGELSAAAPATEVQMVLRFDPPADEAGQAVLQQAGAGAVSWFADTEELASAYARLLNRPVRRIPIPIDGEAIRSAARQRAASPATVLYLGESRREKGFHLLPEIIERTWAGQPAVRFIVQVSPNIAGGEKDIGKAVAALRKLQGPRVELRPSAVPSEDFPSLLASGQILLLPYQADAYRLRSSGLLVQGLASGLRIVAPAEPSWLRDYAARHARPGDVELCPSTAEGFARGVLAHASKPGVPPLPQRLEEEALPRPWSLPRQSVV